MCVTQFHSPYVFRSSWRSFLAGLCAFCGAILVMPLAKYKPTICFSQFDAKFKQHTHTRTLTLPTHLQLGRHPRWDASLNIQHKSPAPTQRIKWCPDDDDDDRGDDEHKLGGDEAADGAGTLAMTMSPHTVPSMPGTSNELSADLVSGQLTHKFYTFLYNFTHHHRHTHTHALGCRSERLRGRRQLDRNVTSIDTKVQRKYLRR